MWWEIWTPSSPSSSSPSFDEKVRKKRRTLAQMKRGEGNDENAVREQRASTETTV